MPCLCAWLASLARTASGNQPRRQPLGHDLRHHLRPARQADSGFGGAHQPRRPRHAFCDRHLNATGLAFNPEGDLFVTSRAEGNVYRIDAGGESTVYSEGMGVATGAAFDAEGNLFVGDRSGTIFKIEPGAQTPQRFSFYATLEASVSAYHLAIDAEGTLFVTGPSLSSNDAIWAIDSHGQTRAWYRGLGRPQGLALSKDGDVYVAACLHGRRGLVRVTPQAMPSLVVGGNNLVGVAFSPLGTTILATNEAVYDVDLGIEGIMFLSFDLAKRRGQNSLRRHMKSEIIAVGSEMLTPFRQDTNSLYITEKLNEIGVTVAFKTIVGDRRKDLVSAIGTALRRTDIVILVGGLGPTEDDLTREAVAETLSLNLRREPCRLRHCMHARPRGVFRCPKTI